MLTQNDIRILSKIFSGYAYVMTTAQLTNEKLFYRDIQHMLEQGLIERIKRGCYHWVDDYGTSEVVIVNRLFPDAVLCMETALFYYRYSDRNPAEWNITIDKNTSRKRTNIDYPFIKAYRVEPELLFIGKTKGEIDFQEVHICDYAGSQPGFPPRFSLVCAPAQTIMNAGHTNIFFWGLLFLPLLFYTNSGIGILQSTS